MDLRAKHPELLDAIRTERELTDTTEKALSGFLEDFARTFA
jgi:F0F1-type ATP synthase alpha subunit